jgi:hypothetical protein
MSYCSHCRTRWERALLSYCPGEDSGAEFVHLNQPLFVKVGDELDVTEARGTAQCDGCERIYVYRWWWGTRLEGYWQETPGHGVPLITVESVEGASFVDRAEGVIHAYS